MYGGAHRNRKRIVMSKPKSKPISTQITLHQVAPETEVSVRFFQGMMNRMAVSYYKYGPVAEGYPEKVNALESLQQRIGFYKETKNIEYLIDAANFAMIEFMHPSYKDAFFEGTDTDRSPGRTSIDGEVSFNRNEEL